MIDLNSLKKMLGMTSDYLPIQEQKALWEEIEYLAAWVQASQPDTPINLPCRIVASVLRCMVSCELTLRAVEAKPNRGVATYAVN